MALLDNITQKGYYQGSDHGTYQFVSLEDIINQFMFAFVGDEKIISKVSRTDVAFWAQRALAEMSFDTFKSVKSHQIDLPSTNVMILPHDYVNYAKISWADSSGIKHPLYPTKHTNNPFEIRQESNGDFEFPVNVSLINNGDFSGDFKTSWEYNAPELSVGVGTMVKIESGVLTFGHSSHAQYENHGKAFAVWQEIDVSDLSYIDISATGTAQAAGNSLNSSNASHTIPDGTIRFGLSTKKGDLNTHPSILHPAGPSANVSADIFDIDYLEWTAGASSSEEKLGIDVTQYDKVYALITSYIPHSNHATPLETVYGENKIDDIVVVNAYASTDLQPASGAQEESSTWSSYKSLTPAENTNDDYEDDVYWPYEGERYGLEPSHAQINGSFYIDELRGKINFSSNISGKTVILDYISDSLGTENEMQVHKFAEDAMYKSILCDVMSARRNVGGRQKMLYKKDKFAAIRKAKLRLSNIKLEELTQILRGRSKWIKH